MELESKDNKFENSNKKKEKKITRKIKFLLYFYFLKQLFKLKKAGL